MIKLVIIVSMVRRMSREVTKIVIRREKHRGISLNYPDEQKKTRPFHKNIVHHYYRRLNHNYVDATRKACDKKHVCVRYS